MFVPAFFHWNAGVAPPLIGLADKETTVPAQTAVSDAPTEMLTGNNGLTVIMIAFELAGLPDAQETLDTITQVMMFPLEGTYV
jgi:hypothetical protein